ncbi:uncharacterized protein LOC129310630 [Prosopis cineraria]|uniref:uncharacterized protein LOC129310630 n=1 Tax=Prosopis cineraria TaxID=364024 RepID=UPI002410751D|nr:uncharacterized protein LOC129310630 [Prosopis cineraria]
MEEKKFVCKYCNKKYPSGKSLGGHIKTHMTTEHSSSQSKKGRTNADDSVVKFDDGRKRKRDFGSEEAASENPIFGLRENPKKTTRFVHSNNAASQQERFCKECGKGFLSLKALCGHMACHSEKDKGTTNKFQNNSGPGFGMKQKLVVDSQSDTETSAPNHPRRSRRMRFKTVNTDKNDQPSFVSLANGSSSVSEVEQEQEEVARCLMLLSKDSSHRGRFVFPAESSENNSVVVEAKSPSVDTIPLNNGKKSCVYNGFEIVEKVVQYNDMKLKSAEIVDSDNSDSGYFRNGHKKLDLDVSIDGYPRNGGFKTPKLEVRSGREFYQNYDAELRKKMLIKNRGGTRSNEPRKLILEDVDYNTTKKGATRKEFINWRKRRCYDSLRQNNSVGVTCKRTPNGFYNEGSLNPESLNSEKIISGSKDSADESDESSTDTDASPAPRPHGSKVINGKKTSKFKKKLKSKKSRDHECPICYKIFKSGQALGGHKRSHFVGGSEENTVVIKHGPPLVPCLIDLNLPAPVDD